MPEYPETHYIQLDDGRIISYCEYGDPLGQTAFYFHGTPGSRHEPLFGHQAARQNHYRLIAPDRPGFGRSDHKQVRTLLGWADDVIQIADVLDLDSFGVIGASGGGPHALACAYAIPDRLAFTVVMGSWAPVADTDLAHEMAPIDRFFSRLASRSPFIFSLPFSWFLLSSRYLSPGLFVKSLDSSLSDADRHMLADPKFSTFFQDDVKEAFTQGVRGPADESILLYQEWGFELRNIQSPVLIIHGEQDKFAPLSFGEYLRKTLPNSTLEKFPDQGHLFLATIFDRLFELIAGSE